MDTTREDEQELLRVAVRVRLVPRRAARVERGGHDLERVERLRREQRLAAEVPPLEQLPLLAPQNARPGCGSPAKRSEISIPTAAARRCSVATLALERPRSSRLTKLSLTPAAWATSRSVSRRSTPDGPQPLADLEPAVGPVRRREIAGSVI